MAQLGDNHDAKTVDLIESVATNFVGHSQSCEFTIGPDPALTAAVLPLTIRYPRILSELHSDHLVSLYRNLSSRWKCGTVVHDRSRRAWTVSLQWWRASTASDARQPDEWHSDDVRVLRRPDFELDEKILKNLGKSALRSDVVTIVNQINRIYAIQPELSVYLSCDHADDGGTVHLIVSPVRRLPVEVVVDCIMEQHRCSVKSASFMITDNNVPELWITFRNAGANRVDEAAADAKRLQQKRKRQELTSS